MSVLRNDKRESWQDEDGIYQSKRGREEMYKEPKKRGSDQKQNWGKSANKRQASDSFVENKKCFGNTKKSKNEQKPLLFYFT